MTEKELTYHQLLEEVTKDVQLSMVAIEEERIKQLQRIAKLQKRAARELDREEAWQKKD